MSFNPWGDEEEDPMEKRRLLTMKQFQSVHAELMLQYASTNETRSRPSNKEKRTRKKKLKFSTEDKTIRRRLTPKQSAWYVLYIFNGNDMDETELKDFCNRFRVPYENFKELLQELNDAPLFLKWAKGATDCYR